MTTTPTAQDSAGQQLDPDADQGTQGEGYRLAGQLIGDHQVTDTTIVAGLRSGHPAAVALVAWSDLDLADGEDLDQLADDTIPMLRATGADIFAVIHCGHPDLATSVNLTQLTGRLADRLEVGHVVEATHTTTNCRCGCTLNADPLDMPQPIKPIATKVARFLDDLGDRPDIETFDLWENLLTGGKVEALSALELAQVIERVNDEDVREQLATTLVPGMHSPYESLPTHIRLNAKDLIDQLGACTPNHPRAAGLLELAAFVQWCAHAPQQAHRYLERLDALPIPEMRRPLARRALHGITHHHDGPEALGSAPDTLTVTDQLRHDIREWRINRINLALDDEHSQASPNAWAASDDMAVRLLEDLADQLYLDHP